MLDGDREARADPHTAQFLAERRAGAGPCGGRGVTAISVGSGGFARGYPLDDRRSVERITNAAPPHEAESCRGLRSASNTELFDILRLRRNLIALALQSRGTSEPP